MIKRPVALASLLTAIAALGACSDKGPLPTSPPVADGAATASARVDFRSHIVEDSRAPFHAVVHSCDGDAIEMNGVAQRRITAFANSADRVHFQLHAVLQNVHGVGVPSGRRYRLVENHIAIYNYDVSLAPFMTNQVFRSRLIGEGPRNDRVLWARFHITVNGRGEPVTEWLLVSGECEH